MTSLLSSAFLDKYPDQPEHMNELGSFVYYRTYSRWLPKQMRRETWKESVQRAVEYNVGISVDHLKGQKMSPPLHHIKVEAETLFDNIFNLRQFLSGRTHWVGGAETGVADKFPLSNFNCSFINITSWSDLAELFYLLLVGTGVGFKATKEMASQLAPLRNDYTLKHTKYKPLPRERRSERSGLHFPELGKASIVVGDSKEGWVEALKAYFELITHKDFNHIYEITINYNNVRPQGERLRTFGGTASGHEPLKEMFTLIRKIVRNELDHTLEELERDTMFKGRPHFKVRPIHILDIGNAIGNNVVVGGVRRTAEIFLCDADDWEVILAKYGINGIWDSYDDEGSMRMTASEKNNLVIDAIDACGGYSESLRWMESITFNDPQVRPLHHRRMSNNSIAFTTQPTRETLHAIFTLMKNEGEPGFVNLEAARRRRPNAEGLNPCAEILLDSYGVCNLTTVNVDAFVLDSTEGYQLDYSGLMQAQALSARAGLRMTCLNLELEHWDMVHKRDRLIGTSLTGWQDAMGKLGYSSDQEEGLLELLNECVRMEALKYANVLRIPIPLLDTTIKPEGTLSQVAGGVSSGLHVAHAPYYVRRIRINADTPLAKTAIALGWRVHAEVGTKGYATIEQLRGADALLVAKTLVIDFPMESNASRTRETQDVTSQFDTYFRFQDKYTAHNSSNTISVRPDEWDTAEDIVWKNWNEFVAVSFLPYDGGTYTLAPYEEITEEEYIIRRSLMSPFDVELYASFEQKEFEKELQMEGAESCETGACPVF